jgi:hypothetical protein
MTMHSDPGSGSRSSSVPSSPSQPAAPRSDPDTAATYNDRSPSACAPQADTRITESVGKTTSASTHGGPAQAGRSGVVDRAREQASNLASQATEQTAQLAGEATQQVRKLMTDQKRRAAERLGTLSGVLRDAAQKLGHDDLGGRVGQYAHRAADQVDSASSYLRTAELQTFVRDTGQLARRRPEVFIGGAFLVGLLAARFLKASSGTSRQADTMAGRPAHMMGGR